MEFDINRVYTAVNADELKIGSKVIFANSMAELREKIDSYKLLIPSYELKEILSDNHCERFVDTNKLRYNLAYLIEEPKKPSYRAYRDGNEAFMYLHDKWLEKKIGNVRAKITCFYEYCVSLDRDVPDFDCLLSDWEIYSETGRNEPCGIIEE